MIKTTIEKILNSQEALNKLADKPLPVKISYRLAKVVKTVGTELELYESERKKLLEKYGTPDNENKYYNIPKDKAEMFNTEFTQLLNTETELSAEKIDLSGEDVKLTAKEFIALEPFIVFGEEE